MISQERLDQLSIADCEEIIHSFDKAIQLGSTASEEIMENRELVRAQLDKLRGQSLPEL